ncbi:MAG: hypothetical protein ACFE96_17280 [Candidatus Hermodarchaeota archaeon]
MSVPRPKRTQKTRRYAIKKKKKLTRNGILLIAILFVSVIVSVFLIIFTLP